jgi:hypothetical protein
MDNKKALEKRATRKQSDCALPWLSHERDLTPRWSPLVPWKAPSERDIPLRNGPDPWMNDDA